MAIVIKNTATVKQSSETLVSESLNLKSVASSINYLLGEINEYWTANQEDQQSFYKGLEENGQQLETIAEYDKEFADAMTEYIDAMEKASQETI